MFVKKLSIFLTLCVAATGVAYLAASRRSEIPEMTIRMLAGTATLTRDGESMTVDGEESLEPGDLIRTENASSAHLRLRGEREAWLGTSDVATEVAVVDESTLGGISGRLRARAADANMVVRFDGIEAHVSDAHFRIDQGTGSARAASYEGEVRLSKPGEPRLSIERFFEAQIPAADLPTETRPYRFDADDDWDYEFLLPVITLDDELTQWGEGLASQLDSQRPGLGYFQALADRKVPFMRKFLKRSPSELLIGFTVARNSEVRSLKRSFRNTMAYRDDGGAWGIVASIMEAKRKVLLADLESVVVATGAGGGGGATEPEFSVASAAGAAQGGSGGGGTLGSTGGGGQSGGGGGGGNGGGGGGGNGANDCGDQVECLQQDIEDELNPDPSPTDPPEDDDDDRDPLTGGIIAPSNP